MTVIERRTALTAAAFVVSGALLWWLVSALLASPHESFGGKAFGPLMIVVPLVTLAAGVAQFLTRRATDTVRFTLLGVLLALSGLSLVEAFVIYYLTHWFT